MKTEYHEVPLKTVLEYYKNGFDQTKCKIVNCETIVDSVKGIVVFKLYVESIEDKEV